MIKKESLKQARNRSLLVFDKVCAHPGYEPINEDTAITLVSAYAKAFESYEATRVRIQEIVNVIGNHDGLAIDKDWLLEVLTAPMVLGYEE